jgi:DNA-binding transcriptional LysR family regulator
MQSSVLSGLTAAHTTALITRQLDVFLGAEDVEDLEGLERHLLLEECYVLLGPAGMPAPADIEALVRLGSERPFIRYSARSRTGVEIERHLRRLRVDFARHQEFDTPHGVTAAVAAGLGWAITTPLCVHEAAMQSAAIACCPLPAPSLKRRLVLVARQRELGPLPGRMAALCREILDPPQISG